MTNHKAITEIRRQSYVLRLFPYDRVKMLKRAKDGYVDAMKMAFPNAYGKLREILWEVLFK